MGGSILSKDWLSRVLVVVACLVLIWPRFGDVIKHPDGYLFAHQGDGLKNYFVFAYYLKNDDGLSFSGLNYPYGDNLLFTDSHPFYALVLNLVDDHLFSISDHAVGILNLTMIAGFLLGGLFIFLLLRHFQLPSWYAIPVTLCILFLSPQIDRFNGHLSLSYAFVIPMVWWLLFRAEKNGKWQWFLVLGAAGFFVGGIHIYFTGIFSAFLLAYFVSKFLLCSLPFAKFLRTNAALLAAAVVPLLLFLSLSTLMDPFNDRPISPYGFYVYHASPASIFLPHISAFTQNINQLLSPRINWEGRAFIGFIPLVFFAGVVFIVVHHRWKKIAFDPKVRSMGAYLLAAFLVLLFSMCIPFEWGLQFLTDLIPPLKQFRALGRFSWVFYYVVGVLAAYSLYHVSIWVGQKSRPPYANGLLALGLIIWGSDATSFYLNHTKTQWNPNHSLQNTSEEYLERFTLANRDHHDFQGIMALPLVGIRTDKMVFDKDFGGYNEAMKCAFHTGLPIIQSSTSRPSFSQSFSNIQLIADERIKKARLDDMDQRPLLLIKPKASALHIGEQRLIDRAQWFWENQEFQFYSLPMKAFDLHKDSFDLSALPTIEENEVLVFASEPSGFRYNGFENQVTKIQFRGLGSLFARNGPLTVFESNLAVDSAAYEVSFWLYIDPAYDGMPSLTYRYGSDDGSAKTSKIDVRRVPDIVDSWVRISVDLQPVSWHQLLLSGHDIRIDELLLRKSNVNVKVEHDSGEILINNFPIHYKK